jgi:RNA polymerase sigma factor FliA
MTSLPPVTRLTPNPQREAEDELWSAYQSSKSSSDRERLFRRYQPLAKNMAGRYKRSEAGMQLEYEEVFQLASTGLIESIDRFKPELGIPFRYFANRRISGAILNGIAKYSELNQQVSSRRRVERERVASLRKDSKKPQNIDERLDLLGEIAAGLALGFMLEEAASNARDPSSPGQDAFETLAWKQLVKLVRDEIQQLLPQQRDIMIWHYSDGLPFDQVASIMGLSKGRISQIHKAAVALLQKRLLHVKKIWLEG